MEAGEDELLLAGVGVDVAHGEDARDVRLKAGGVDDDLLAVELEAPVLDRAELRLQTEEDEQMVERDAARDAVGARDEHFGELAVGFVEARDLAHFELHLPVLAQFLHLGDGGGLGAEAVAAVNESPPPQMTTFLPSKTEGSLQL